MDLALAIVFAFWVFGQILVLCELCEYITGQFGEIDSEIMQYDWYKFPIEIQKMLPILICGTQNPTVMKGYINVEYSRETFKNVIYLTN